MEACMKRESKSKSERLTGGRRVREFLVGEVLKKSKENRELQRWGYSEKRVVHGVRDFSEVLR